ncbi:MAG: sulfotransferase [Parvularculaceae bacterium]|nr:sulfotransferase [Parvularculaceae bacterium]
MTDADAAYASIDAALARGAHLLRRDPAAAEEQALEILKAVPGHPQALLLEAQAKRRLGAVSAAATILRKLALEQPRAAAVFVELALVEAAGGAPVLAFNAMERAISLKPSLVNVWRALGDALSLADESDGAAEAYARHVRAEAKDPRLIEAAAALARHQVPVAERLLKDYLKSAPTDVAAIRMLAEVAARLGRFEDSTTLLTRALELAPGFDAARFNLASVLLRRNRPAEALAEIDRLLAAESGNPGFLSLKAAALGRIGDYAGALAAYEQVLMRTAGQAKIWMSYGHVLKTVGRQEESIAAYRRALDLSQSLGEAWWSLANLKTFRFEPGDVAAMTAALARSNLGNEDRYHLHFALGKALEDEARYAESFSHYAEGNRLRRGELAYDPAENRAAAARAKAVYTEEFFAARAGQGCPAEDPVFIVGLPRAGSTLIEQILSSHSAVEGTMELPDIIAIARELGFRKGKGANAPYPASVAALSPDDLARLGAEYLRRTRVQRKTGKPRFIDKMPNNFAHAGLIMAILPNAKIIDARRHPLACCFSNFKQHFARGQSFTYDLAEIGGYYRDYIGLMAHFDAVAPGRIHRVFYERMVADTEGEVRRLLAYCGLPFEESCLRFYENDRAVRTASSEQVRRPIFSDGVDQWRNFATWLGPLRAALGDALDKYPETASI